MTIDIDEPELEALHAEPTGSALVAAFQASPFPELEFEPERFPMPVRDVAL